MTTTTRNKLIAQHAKAIEYLASLSADEMDAEYNNLVITGYTETVGKILDIANPKPVDMLELAAIACGFKKEAAHV